MSVVRGQIITRAMNDDPNRKDHIRVIIYGIVSVHKSSFLNKEGMQFIVSESQMADALGLSSDNVELTVHKAGAVDLSKMTKGSTPDYMLTEGVWRT